MAEKKKNADEVSQEMDLTSISKDVATDVKSKTILQGVAFSFEETQRATKKAINVSTPLIGLATPDPTATISWVIQETSKSSRKFSYFQWDIIRGFTTANAESESAYQTFIKSLMMSSGDGNQTTKEDIITRTSNLPEFLNLITNVPRYTIIFIHNAHRFIDVEAVMQGFSNLRNIFKTKGCSVVMLGDSFSGRIPSELSNDVVVIEEELPTREKVKTIVSAQVKTLVQQLQKDNVEENIITKLQSEDELNLITNYLTGMSTYAVEQRFSLAVTKRGMDYNLLRQQKRQAVEMVTGLKYETWNVRFSDIGGLTPIKNQLLRYMNGRLRPQVLVRIDEMEKYMGGIGGANTGGDTSGVSQDALGVVLSNMEDQGWTGIILVGIQGSGKSMISKALAGEFNIPHISQDFGAARGSLVGQSERNIRNQMKAIRGMAGSELGGALFIATCNNITAIPVELKRRFKLGIWFFDLPTKEELDNIWALSLAKYGLTEKPLDEEHLTGSDVDAICQMAYACNCSLQEAREGIVPVHLSDPKNLKQLREFAHEKFLSASHGGVYLEPSARLLKENVRPMNLN